MERIVSDFIASIEFGEVQSHGKMFVAPLFSPKDEGPEYITLREALSGKQLIVTEVDEAGSVSEVTVINRAEVAVLLLDGEELTGAKQNRVLNTTILLPPGSETVIPVSCTEQGRWFYTSDLFSDSGVVMNASLRQVKTRSVTRSLECSRQFFSDQDAVWDGIHEFSKVAECLSPTEALKDVVESRDEELEDFSSAFELMPRQRGLFVFINDKPVGFDIVSRESAYRDYHRKLVRSYAMDAVLDKDESGGEVSIEDAREFLQTALCSKEKKYRSKGLGWDYRYDGEAAVGSSLVCEGSVVHAAFFSKKDDSEDRPGERLDFMSDMRTRRNYRR